MHRKGRRSKQGPTIPGHASKDVGSTGVFRSLQEGTYPSLEGQGRILEDIPLRWSKSEGRVGGNVWDKRNSTVRGSEVRETSIAADIARSCQKTRSSQTKIHHAGQVPNSMRHIHIVFLKQK